MVSLESTLEKPLETAREPSAEENAEENQRSRIEMLEARVEALEAALRDSMAASPPAISSTMTPKFLWLTIEPGQTPSFSPEQGRVLFHNLGSVRKQAIAIRTPTGDSAARSRAEWFKSIFESAGWTVRGPEEITPDATTAGLSLAVPELPVAKDAAATYFALKAAGFALIPVLDTTLGSETGADAAALSLTLPMEKAA